MRLLPETDTWTAAGASGREYRFLVRRRDAAFAPEPALYVLGYHHPKGHLAGYTVHPAYLGATHDLAARLKEHGQADHARVDCLRYEMANCVCVLENAEPEDHPDCMRDLAGALDLPCGHDPL